MNFRGTTVAVSRVALLVALSVVFYLAFTDHRHAAIEAVNDKAIHVLAFGVLALLSDLSFPAKGFGQAIVLPLLGCGLLIEVVQYLLPYREFSLQDWIADAIGIAVYGLCILILKKVPLLRRQWEPEQ